MPFNPDEYLAKKQADTATPSDSAAVKFDPDSYLQSKGVQTLPNNGQIQDGASAAASYANTVGQAAKAGFGTSMQPSLAGGTEAVMGAVDSLARGENTFGDQGHFAGISNFMDNFQRARNTQQQQIDTAKDANPSTFAGVELATSLPRIIAENETFGLFGAGAAESFYGSKKESVGQTLEDVLKGGTTNLLLGKSFETLGAGVRGLNIDKAIEATGKALGPEAQVALTKAFSNSVVKQSAQTLSNLAAATVGGGAVDMLIRQPKTWDDALESFKEGSQIGFGLGVASETGKGLFAWGGNIVRKANAATVQQEVQNAETKLESYKTSSEIKKADVQTAENAKAQTQSEGERLQNTLQTAQTQKAKHIAILSNEENTSSRVSNLPQFVDSNIKGTMDNIGQKIQSRISGFEQSPVDFHSNLSKAYGAVNDIKTFTPDAQSAKSQLLNVLQTIENSAQKTRTSFDPVLNKAVGETTTTLTPNQLWGAKQQLQDLLYNKNFLEASRGTGLRNVITNVERGLREQLNSLDPSGELAKLNDAYSNLSKGRSAFIDEGGLPFFLAKAKNPNDPKVIQATKEIEKHFMDSASLQQDGIKGAGLKPETAADPIIGNQVKALKGLLHEEATSAISDYRTLLESKKQLPKLETEITRISDKLESQAAKARAADISVQKSNLASLNANNKVELGKQTLDNLKNPSLDVPGFGSIGKKIEFLKNVKDAAANDTGVKALKTIGSVGVKAANIKALHNLTDRNAK